MPITQRGNSFMVSHGSGKDRVRLTRKTLPEAELLLAELEAAEKAAAASLLLAATRGDPTKTLQDAYDRTYREKWKGSKGERTTVLNGKQMLALLGADTLVTEIDSDAIADALNALEDGDDDTDGNSAATINKKLAALNVMLKGCMDRGWLKAIPHTKRRKEGNRRTFWYSEDDEREMLNACYRLGLPELADWITFGIDSGMRRSEMLRLKTVDCFSGHIHLHNGQTKNDQGRVIPTTELAEAIVQKARDKGHDRVFQGMTQAILRGQWDALRTYLKKEGDPKYIVHVLRHTCATRLAIGGATAPQIMAYMGHKAIQTSMIYIHLTGHNLTGVADLLKRSPMPRPELKVVGG